MRLSRMTEAQVTKAYISGKITREQHNKRLRQIADKRHVAEDKKHRNRAGGYMKW